jgi:hypothetical protein
VSLIDEVPLLKPYKMGSGVKLAFPSEPGRVSATRNVFMREGQIWSYRGATMFRLYHRWLMGEPIDDQVAWMRRHGVNVARVLGFVPWAGKVYGSSTPGYWEQLLTFIDYMDGNEIRVEWVAFAGMQDFPQVDQRAHLRRLVDLIGNRPNVFIEVCNEPWQNGCEPTAVWSRSNSRPCPMAYGLYVPTVKNNGGTWVGDLAYLDYVTFHNDRDPQAFARKGKDNAEMRDGYGDGTEERFYKFDGTHTAVVGDEPIGAAERDTIGGRQRSASADDFFWYHANTHMNGAGSTFHCDAGLDGLAPDPGGDQEACANACSLAWANVPVEFQTGQYTRGGLGNLPLAFDESKFDDQTGRIYARLLGNRALALAIRPKSGWTPTAVGGWRIVSTAGPMDSLVYLER